jgi:signal transduction histidine kinase
VIRHREPVIAPDIAAEARVKTKTQLQMGLRSSAFLPLIIDDEVRGVMHVASRKLGYFDEAQKEHLSAIARQMSAAFENRDLFYGLQRSRDELAKANKVKSEFLGVISHELRTPINLIMGYTNLLRERAVEQEDGLKKISSAAYDLLAVVDSILYATLLEADQLELESEEVSVASLLAEVKAGYEVTTPNPINLIWDLTADLPATRTDRNKLKHILNNLIDNAVKFTGQGKVTVSAKLLENPANHAEMPAEGMDSAIAANAKRWFEFKVADTGGGIPPEVLPHIFDKFYQADSSQSRPYEGVGLGLYIVKKFAELLGGGVEVESEMGKGSSFVVTIPAD